LLQGDKATSAARLGLAVLLGIDVASFILRCQTDEDDSGLREIWGPRRATEVWTIDLFFEYWINLFCQQQLRAALSLHRESCRPRIPVRVRRRQANRMRRRKRAARRRKRVVAHHELLIKCAERRPRSWSGEPI
jgi:hypothetical protein